MVLFLCLGSLACSDLTRPNRTADQAAPAAVAEPAVADEAAPDRISATHLLIAYRGAMRASPEVTRSKEEARLLTEALLLAIRNGEDFDALIKKKSDEPSAPTRGGKLGSFGRGAMAKAFEETAFALRVGQLSSVVETAFGFHIIRRDS